MTHARNDSAGSSPERASLRASRTTKLKKYRVLCAVTRTEWYEILAPDEEAARRTAFCDGEMTEQGDTTGATELDVEEVAS